MSTLAWFYLVFIWFYLRLFDLLILLVLRTFLFLRRRLLPFLAPPVCGVSVSTLGGGIFLGVINNFSNAASAEDTIDGGAL